MSCIRVRQEERVMSIGLLKHKRDQRRVCAERLEDRRLLAAVVAAPGFSTNALPGNDDGSTDAAIPLGFTINFFGDSFDSAFVNNNGNITFGNSLSTFTPNDLRSTQQKIIAPF